MTGITSVSLLEKGPSVENSHIVSRRRKSVICVSIVYAFTRVEATPMDTLLYWTSHQSWIDDRRRRHSCGPWTIVASVCRFSFLCFKIFSWLRVSIISKKSGRLTIAWLKVRELVTNTVLVNLFVADAVAPGGVVGQFRPAAGSALNIVWWIIQPSFLSHVSNFSCTPALLQLWQRCVVFPFFFHVPAAVERPAFFFLSLRSIHTSSSVVVVVVRSSGRMQTRWRTIERWKVNTASRFAAPVYSIFFSFLFC